MKERKLSIFHITSIVLTAILVVFIVVSIAIIIDLKNKTDETKEKNDGITQSLICENLDFCSDNLYDYTIYLNNKK